MRKIFKTIAKIILILILFLAVAIPIYYNYWRNSKTLNTFEVFKEPTELKYSDIIWKSDSIQNMLFEKAFFFVPVKIEGIKEKLYMQFDTGVPETYFYGITLNSLIKNNKILKKELKEDGKEFLLNPTLNIGETKFKAQKLPMLNRGDKKIDSSFIVVGSIGLDAIIGRKLILDFKKNKIAITEKNLEQIGKRLDFVENASVNKFPLLIPAKIGTESTRLFFDSGSSMFSLLTSEKRLKQLSGSQEIEKLCCIGSGGKDYPIYRKQVNSNIEIGKTIRSNEFVYGFFKLNIIDYIPKSILYGITGNRMFDNQVIVIDTENNKFGIER